MSILDGFLSLGSKANTVGDASAPKEGIVGAKMPELTLEMADEDLLALRKRWEARWESYLTKVEPVWKENERYWKGKQYSDVESVSEKRPLLDNRLFTAVETFLPIVARQNPEPVVTSDNTEGGEELARKVGKLLSYQADIQKLKLKNKKAMRHWMLYHIACVKVGWDEIEDDIRTVVVRPQKLILDPDATIDEDGYTGEYIGEYRKDKAKTLQGRFADDPGIVEWIGKEVDGKLDTEMNYVEWWTDDYIFWTCKDKVLGKAKNPHWNYESEQSAMDPYGQTQATKVPGRNHFNVPRKPYVFLSVFNVGLQPLDDTGLIQQNLSLQDLINKRMRQIDRNVDGMNGGAVVSGDHFTLEEAGKVTETLRRGGTVWVPSGSVNEAYRRDSVPALPGDVYNSVVDARNEVDNTFGTHGVTRGESDTAEKTLGGKIIAKEADSSRIGFIADYLEQFNDEIFNWWVQLMHVYYDEPHAATVLGEAKSKEYVTLVSDQMVGKLLVSVREGSLIPKDPMVERNEAVDLWSAGAISPVELYEKLDWPNPRKSAEDLLTWQMVKSGALPPTAMFPDFKMPAPPPSGGPQGMPPAPTPQGASSAPAPEAMGQNPQNPVDMPIG